MSVGPFSGRSVEARGSSVSEPDLWTEFEREAWLQERLLLERVLGWAERPVLPLDEVLRPDVTTLDDLGL